jgi:hypothetical protein
MMQEDRDKKRMGQLPERTQSPTESILGLPEV